MGARLTGGGFGGAVLAWTMDSFSKEEAISISHQYEKKWQEIREIYDDIDTEMYKALRAQKK